MHPDVQKLLEVQKVDQKVARLRRAADSVPQEKAQRQTELDALTAAKAGIEKESTENELRTRELELAIKQSDSEIKNLEGKLGLIKNNAEYQAILFQIEAVKKERDVSEEESLVLLEKAGPLSEASAKASAELDEASGIFTEFSAKAETLIAQNEAEIAEVGAGRDGLVDGVLPELVEEYERLIDVRESVAICAAENQYCQGCYTQFTVNDQARLQGGRTIVRCSSCQRILYLAE